MGIWPCRVTKYKNSSHSPSGTPLRCEGGVKGGHACKLPYRSAKGHQKEVHASVLAGRHVTDHNQWEDCYCCHPWWKTRTCIFSAHVEYTSWAHMHPSALKGTNIICFICDLGINTSHLFPSVWVLVIQQKQCPFPLWIVSRPHVNNTVLISLCNASLGAWAEQQASLILNYGEEQGVFHELMTQNRTITSTVLYLRTNVHMHSVMCSAVRTC
jgi:hypothetical protein